MSAAHRPAPGVRIGGKYRLLKRLGVGGMGEVWVARNDATGAQVAVKLCTGHLAGDDTRQRFRQEARLGAMLSHRSIVRVFDLVEEADGTLLLVMELLRGTTLEDHLASFGKLPAVEALAIAVAVLSALAHAHAMGIVHRDVTPANILLAVDPDGHVTPKLVDFGIAKMPGSGVRTMDGTVLGTPRYMSPEQIRGESAMDARSDLFSVGVVLYEMLTGVSPFAATTPSGSIAAVLERVVDPDEAIDPRVWFEIHRALAKRAYERHPSAREFADALLAAGGVTEADLTRELRQTPPVGSNSPMALSHDAPFSTGGRARRAGGLSKRRTLAIIAVGGMLLGTVAAAGGPALARHASRDDAPATVTFERPAAPPAIAQGSIGPASPPEVGAGVDAGSTPASPPAAVVTESIESGRRPSRGVPPSSGPAQDHMTRYPRSSAGAASVDKKPPRQASRTATPRPVGSAPDF